MPENTTRISKAFVNIGQQLRQLANEFEAMGNALANVGNDMYVVKARMDALIEEFPEAKRKSDAVIAQFLGTPKT